MNTQHTNDSARDRERRFRLYLPGSTVDLRGGDHDGFPLMVDVQGKGDDNPDQHNDSAAPVAHSHDFIELVYVRSGSGLHWHGGKRYSVYAGDCFVILQGEEHTYRSTSGLAITNILFYPELLEPFRAQLQSLCGFRGFFTTEPLFREESLFRHKLHLSLTNQARLSALVDSLVEELGSRTAGYEVSATGVFLQTIVLLSRAFDRMVYSGGMQQQALGRDSLVSAAIAYLESNYASDIRVDDIARSVCLSPSRLSHVFKQTTGMSLVDYLNRMRIDRACQMLAQSDRPVTAIALELGFSDSAYFTRLFGKTVGMSPSAYRRQAELSRNSAGPS